ncbi:MAG: RHS repeat-associated core domain-containing protein [Microlunatus sp.]
MSITSRWAQERSPTWGAAVFGPDQAITGTTPAAVTNTDWWKRADLSYTDTDGYTINTAGWGAGDWQYTANDYDTNGNVIRTWDEYGTRWVLAQGLEPGAGEQFATVTKYNDDITSGGTVVTPAGTLVTDVWAPANWAIPTAPTGPDYVLLRTHTKMTYDQGAPNSGIDPNTDQPYRLVTNQVVTSETPDIPAATVDDTLSISFTGYDKVESSDPKSGWDLGTATSITVDMDQSASINSGDITTVTRFDGQGRVIENRQPTSNGADAGTRQTIYYTGDASASVAACRNKPQYAGWVCQVGPIAQPSGQSMPVTTTTAYTWDGQTATEQDVSGSVTSTTTTTFNAQDRPVTTTTSVSGLSSSTAVPVITTSYDLATGQTTGTSSTAGTTAMTYDNWGRQLSYSNTPTGQPVDTAATTYNNLGRVTKIVDGNGETRYTYDGTDANGVTETRGLVTGLTVKTTGGSEYTTTGAYDHAGSLVTEKLPGQITRYSSYDLAGQNIFTAYHGTIIDPDTGDPTEDPQPLAVFSTNRSADGKIAFEWGPGSDQTYYYDQAGRLTMAEDNSAYFPTRQNHLGCQTNTYTFDANGNRTSQKSAEPGSGGACTLTGATTTTRAYDAADRPTTGGNGTGSYTYDQLGRQTKIPAADAPHDDLGDIDLAYYDTDAIKTITQDGTTTSFTLDGVNRRNTQTATGGASTSTLHRHYTDDGDNPTWTEETTGGSTITTRYTEGLDGDLGITLTTQAGTTTAQLALTTNRGDNATTLTIPATGTAIPDAEGWHLYNEYGDLRAPTPPSPTPGSIYGIGYGWLGAKQRATLNTGLTLMGARLYNQTTGLFTSTDPIFGGNVTLYAYPADPINSTDLTGKWCVAGVGTTCTRYLKNENKTLVPVRHNIKKKLKKTHNLTWKSAKWLMPRLRYDRVERNRSTPGWYDIVYRRRIHEYICNYWGTKCYKSGRSLVVRAIVNFGKGSDGRTIGLKSMYCEGYYKKCPSWINGRKKK